MSETMAVVKMGVTGVAVGTATAWVTDMIYSKAMAQIGNAATPGGIAGRAALQAVAAGAFSAVMVYAGDQAFSMLTQGAADPLFHVMYYQTAIQSMATFGTSIRSVRMLIDSATSGIRGMGGGGGVTVWMSPQPPSQQQSPPQQPAVVPMSSGGPVSFAMSKKGGCMKGSGCGGIF